MKYLLLAVAFIACTSEKCSHKKKVAEDKAAVQVKEPVQVVEESKEMLPCLREIVGKGEKESPPNAPVRIEEYLWNGKRVFLITANCCDQFNEVVDDSCHVICASSGGFSGRGDGKCPDFSKEAKLVRQVWARKDAPENKRSQ